MGELNVAVNPIEEAVTPKTILVPSISKKAFVKGGTSILFRVPASPNPVKEKPVRLTVAPLLKEVSTPKELKVSVLRLLVAAVKVA